MTELKLPMQIRDVEGIEIRKQDNKTSLSFSASSEAPVERYYGNEVLSHEKSAVRMDRIKRGAAPLLFNHNWDDPIGMIDAGRLADGKLVVDAHLFDTDRAREVGAMIEGGLRNVSLGYRINIVEENTKTNVYTARDWEPFEVSIVTIPADPSVGIGRALGEEIAVRMIRPPPNGGIEECPANSSKDLTEARESRASSFPPPVSSTTATTADRSNAMSVQDNASAGDNAGKTREQMEREERDAREKLEQRTALELEQGRVRAIEKLAKANKIADNIRDAWVRQGYNLEQVSTDILNIMEERGRTNPTPATLLGLTEHETQRFSFSRAILAAASKDNDWSKAGFELECSKAIAQRLGKVAENHRFYVPFEVQQRPVDGRRDLTSASAGAGGYLVSTQNLGFVEMLRNRSVAMRAGARRLSGLSSNITIPRQSAAATAYWLANEASTLTESQQTFVQVALTPKTAGAYTEISRQLLLQSSPGAEGIVTDDLAQQVALAIDLAALEGSGSGGQPTGISNTSGIGSVTGTSLAAAGIIEFQTDVASSNVMPQSGAYVTTPIVAGLLMARPELPSTGTERLWKGNIWDGTLFDFPAMTTNQVTAGTMVFGDFSELVIGEWGVLEVEVNPYANFQAGIIGVRAICSVDVGVRRPFAFSRATSIT